MNAGDKVRLIHGREEGIVTRILSAGQVEIEIEDGFRIPVLVDELTIVSSLEAERMKKPSGTNQQKIQPRAMPFAQKGIFLALLPAGNEFSLNLINHSDWELPYTLATLKGDRLSGLAAGFLAPAQHQLLTHLAQKDIESWPVFELIGLRFSPNFPLPDNPLRKRIRFRAQNLAKHWLHAPVLEKEAYLYPMDDEPAVVDNPTKSLDLEALKEKMFTANEPKADIPRAAKIVDLHIEKLTDDYHKMGGAEILALQLRTFENALEAAIAEGQTEITFVHGVGSGFLRNELHKKLSGKKHVAFFKDAMKEKFGYGATLVSLQ